MQIGAMFNITTGMR